MGALGFFLLPILPVGYSFGSELTYPISETMSNGVLSLFAQLAGTGITSISTKLIDKDPMYACYLMTALTFVAALSSRFVKEDLRRLKFK